MRYHVQVYVREGSQWHWRRVRPTGGDPYVFSKDEAENYIRSMVSNDFQFSFYRLEELP